MNIGMNTNMFIAYVIDKGEVIFGYGNELKQCEDT